MDDGTDAAVLYADGAVLRAGQSAGEHVRGVDVARHVQVLDSAAVLDVAEGRGVLLAEGGVSRAVAYGQRVALSVEGAGEVLAAGARHAGDGVVSRADVCTELDGLAVEEALVTIGQQVAEGVPARGGVDGVGRARQREVVVVRVANDVGEGYVAFLEVVGSATDGDSGYDVGEGVPGVVVVVPAFDDVDVFGVERYSSPAVEADAVADVEHAGAPDGAVGVGGDVHISEGDRAAVDDGWLVSIATDDVADTAAIALSVDGEGATSVDIKIKFVTADGVAVQVDGEVVVESW